MTTSALAKLLMLLNRSVGLLSPRLIDCSAPGSEVRLEAQRVGDQQESLVGFQKLSRKSRSVLKALIAASLPGRLCAQLTISPAESIAT